MRRSLILFFIAVVGLVILLVGDAYYQAEAEEDNQAALVAAADNAADSVEDALQQRVRVVRDLQAFMLASSSLPAQNDFNRYAAGVLAESPGLRALQYVTPDLIIAYVYPLAGNESALGLDLSDRPGAPYVYQTLEQQQITISDPVTLVQGPLGSVIRLPLFRDGEVSGLVQGVFDVEPLLTEVGSEVEGSFAISLKDSKGDYFWGPTGLEGEVRTIQTGAKEQVWTLILGWAQGAPAPDPTLRLVLWGLGSAFLGLLIFTVNRALKRTVTLAEAVATRTAELAGSERKYRTLVEQAGDGIVLVDEAGNYLDANPAALKMLGYTREELLALNVDDVVPADEQARKPLLLDQLKPGESILAERWLQRKDGTRFPAESSTGRLPDGRYLGIIRDITERREAEEALQRREAILEAVSFSAEQILRSGDWHRHVGEVLSRLGRAAGVSRAYIFQNRWGKDEQLGAYYLYEWSAPGIPGQISVDELRWLSYEEVGGGEWRNLLARGEALAGPVAQFSPRMQALLSAQAILSLAVVPIFAGERWWGFIGFDDCETERQWSPAEIGALQAAADTLGAAIVRERNEHRIRQNAARAEALVRTAARLNEHTDRDEVLEIICEEAQRVLDVSAAAITLYDQESDSFEIVTGLGVPLDLKEQIKELPYALYEQYVSPDDDLPLLLEDVQALPDLPYHTLYAAHDLRTVLFARLVYEGELIGGLLVATFGETRTFSRGEQKLLSGLADQAAQAITNAGLFSKTRRLLQQTRAQARQVQRIMDTVPEGVILLDAQRRILLANPAGSEYLARMTDASVGEKLERVDGRSLDEVLTANTEGTLWQELQPENSERVFELAERPIEAEQGTAGWVLVIREVTEERRRQQYVQRQERLATVGQLAAGIAHDFNNIMAVITLYSQSLERNPDFVKREEYLRTISTQARHAADLISQILDFSRRAVMERGQMDLQPFVKEIVKLLQRTLPETIEVVFTVADGDYLVNADPTRLQQVLMNLALNARDAMPDGGVLRLRLETVTVVPGRRPPLPEMQPGEWVRLSVLDTGTGIAPENLPRIFEPFFTTKERGDGTGLGLAQVYGIVKQHGGEIDVSSPPGSGTTFSIYLPAAGMEYEAPELDQLNAQEKRTGETILLVEDNEPTRLAICDALELLGYDVLAAASGKEGLSIFKENRQGIDLVLSDIVMPEMGGVELYHRLLEMDPEIKMMVMTGYPLEDEGRALLEEGIITWIRKPFSQDEIAASIRAVLDAENGL